MDEHTNTPLASRLRGYLLADETTASYIELAVDGPNVVGWMEETTLTGGMPVGIRATVRGHMVDDSIELDIVTDDDRLSFTTRGRWLAEALILTRGSAGDAWGEVKFVPASEATYDAAVARLGARGG